MMSKQCILKVTELFWLFKNSLPKVLRTSCCEELSITALSLVLALLPLPAKAVTIKNSPSALLGHKNSARSLCNLHNIFLTSSRTINLLVVFIHRRKNLDQSQGVANKYLFNYFFTIFAGFQKGQRIIKHSKKENCFSEAECVIYSTKYEKWFYVSLPLTTL